MKDYDPQPAVRGLTSTPAPPPDICSISPTARLLDDIAYIKQTSRAVVEEQRLAGDDVKWLTQWHRGVAFACDEITKMIHREAQ